MNVFELTQALVDIESITGNEAPAGDYVARRLSTLAARHDGRVERIAVEPNRFNVLATWGNPVVTLSTHIDTVPPYFPSSEDDEYIYGRGACDTRGHYRVHDLRRGRPAGRGRARRGAVVCGRRRAQQRRSIHAAKDGRGSRFLINGEPTENKLARGLERRAAHGSVRQRTDGPFGVPGTGRIGHRETAGRAGGGPAWCRCPWIRCSGPSTLNIGTIGGGRAPNVVADEARAEFLIRLVDDGEATRTAVHAAAAERRKSAIF